MEITEKSNREPWNTGNSTCKKSLSHGKHADTGWWRVHQHPVQMIVRNALLWAPVPVRLLLEMDEIHTATAQTRVWEFEWAEGGRSADLHHMWEEKCHRRWTICETCVFLCVWKTQRESVFVTCFLSGFYWLFSVNWDFSLLSNISRGAWQRCQTCSLLIATLSHIWAFWVMGLFAFWCWRVIGDVSVLE